MRISDGSSDVCSSDIGGRAEGRLDAAPLGVAEALDLVDAAAADNADDRRRSRLCHGRSPWADPLTPLPEGAGLAKKGPEKNAAQKTGPLAEGNVLPGYGPGLPDSTGPKAVCPQ